MRVAPGGTVRVTLYVGDADGPANADSTPAVSVLRNGSASGISPTIAGVSPGRYRVSYTAPSNFAAGDVLEGEATIVLGGVTHYAGFTVIVDSLAASVGGAPAAYTSTLASVTTNGGTLNNPPAYSLAGYMLTVNGRTCEVAAHTASQAAFTLTANWKVQPSTNDAVRAVWVEGTDATGLAAERAAIADRLLGRHHEGGSDGGRTVTQCLQPLRNKVTWPGGTLTVCTSNDTTTSWTGTVTRTAGNPVTGVDPA